MRSWLIFWLLLVIPLLAIPLDRYESSVAAYEAADRLKAPQPGGTLFLGSSTFTLWGQDLEREFSLFHALNRGFGGATIAEIDHYLERVCFPYQPRLILFYAGTNDIADGHSPQQVVSDFAHLTAHLRQKLPNTRVAYVSMAMPPSRIRFEREYASANQLLREFTQEQPNMDYLDVSKLLLDDQGRPRGQFYREDQLHMKPSGYALWAPVLREYLEEHQ